MIKYIYVLLSKGFMGNLHKIHVKVARIFKLPKKPTTQKLSLSTPKMCQPVQNFTIPQF